MIRKAPGLMARLQRHPGINAQMERIASRFCVLALLVAALAAGMALARGAL